MSAGRSLVSVALSERLAVAAERAAIMRDCFTRAKNLCLAGPVEHGQHQATVGGRGVRPGVARGAETGPTVGDRGEGVQLVAGRARQPVEPGHHQHVAGGELVERAAKPAAVGLRPARQLAEHLLAPGLGELAQLRCNALTVRGYPGVAVFRAVIMSVTSATEKFSVFSDLISLHRSCRPCENSFAMRHQEILGRLGGHTGTNGSRPGQMR